MRETGAALVLAVADAVYVLRKEHGEHAWAERLKESLRVPAQRFSEALGGQPGRTFLAHMRRLEAENAELREDVLRYLAENVRIRGLLAHFEHCPHGCQDAGFCPHYKRVRDLGLFGRGPVQTSAPPAPAVVPRSDVHNFGHGPALRTCTCGKGPWCVCGFCQACQGLDLGLPFPVGSG
jgi:hypothetical protein